jgi:hypothetical protein
MLGINFELLLQAREMVGREPSSSALIPHSPDGTVFCGAMGLIIV